MGYISQYCNSSQPVKYLFIDGSYLQKSLASLSNRLYDGRDLPIQYDKLATNHTKIFYYDCPAAIKTSESQAGFENRLQRQENLNSTLRSLRGWHVYEGVLKGVGKRVRQKEVDILIAVDMLSHAFRKNMSIGTLLAGDLDFRPLVDALVRDGMFVELMFDPKSISRELAEASDARIEMDAHWLHGHLKESFRIKNPLPQRYVSGSDGIEGKLIETGLKQSLEASLFSTGNKYIISQVDNYEEDKFRHLSHDDVAFLKKVHAEMYGDFLWSRS